MLSVMQSTTMPPPPLLLRAWLSSVSGSSKKKKKIMKKKKKSKSNTFKARQSAAALAAAAAASGDGGGAAQLAAAAAAAAVEQQANTKAAKKKRERQRSSSGFGATDSDLVYQRDSQASRRRLHDFLGAAQGITALTVAYVQYFTERGQEVIPAYWAPFGLVFSSAFICFIVLSRSREVVKLFIRREARSIRIVTNLAFGFTRNVDIPLRDIENSDNNSGGANNAALLQARNDPSNRVVQFGVRGRSGFYVLDKQGDVFNSKAFTRVTGHAIDGNTNTQSSNDLLR
jgi:hypothetical protein